jgi:hypothetical protein
LSFEASSWHDWTFLVRSEVARGWKLEELFIGMEVVGPGGCVSGSYGAGFEDSIILIDSWSLICALTDV